MKQTFILSTICLAVLSAFPCIAAADEEQKSLAVDTSLSLYNTYMFRGLRIYDGSTIQPSITASYDTGFGTVSGNLWMHITGDSDASSAERFTELDETIKFEKEVGPFVLAVGNVWYTYSDYGDGTDIADSAEVFGSVVYDAFLSPTLSYYHDWREYDSDYIELGLSHEFSELDSSETTLVPFASFGFGANSEKVYEDNGLEQITTGFLLNMSVGDVGVSPNVNYSFKIDDYTVNQLWFGLTANYSL